jgi:Fe-S-cluster containining protein
VTLAVLGVDLIESDLPKFDCNGCGACCRHLLLTPETEHMNRGDGTCLHYDDDSKRCKIYNERPDICRVDRQYIANYQHDYSWIEFCYINAKACEMLVAREV